MNARRGSEETCEREIHEFDPLDSKSLPNISAILYEDERDPAKLTDAGLVNDYYVRILERLYVAERMASVSLRIQRKLAGRIPLLVPGEIPEISMSIVRHDGGMEFVSLAVRTLGIDGHWRVVGRLCGISIRLLLGRAKTRIRQNPEDAHAKEVLRQTRIGLARGTGTRKASSG